MQPYHPQTTTTTTTATATITEPRQHTTTTTTTTTATNTEAHQQTTATNRGIWTLKNVIILAICVIFLLFVAALLIIHLIMDVGTMKVSQLDVQDMYVKHRTLTKTSVALEANATLGYKFKTTGDVNPTPGLALFNLTMVTVGNYTVSTFGNASYSISEKREQLLVVHFKPHVNQLPEEEVWVLDRWMAEEYPQMILTVYFHWKLKHEEAMVIPPSPRHADFICSVPYARNRAIARKFYPLRCKRVSM